MTSSHLRKAETGRTGFGLSGQVWEGRKRRNPRISDRGSRIYFALVLLPLIFERAVLMLAITTARISDASACKRDISAFEMNPIDSLMPSHKPSHRLPLRRFQ